MMLQGKIIRSVLAAAGIMLVAAAGLPRPKVQRIGMVIGLKADKIEEYKSLHAGTNPGVRDLLRKYHIRNFSIYLRQFDDGGYYLFGYYEYMGSDYKTDLENLAEEERNLKWLTVTDPMQVPFSGEKGWALMPEIYHND